MSETYTRRKDTPPPIIRAVVSELSLPQPLTLSRRMALFGGSPDEIKQSVGYLVFPPGLESRIRPDTVLKRPLDRLLKKNNPSLDKLGQAQKHTVLDILQMSSKDLTKLLGSDKTPSLRENLSNYLKGLIISGHVHFVSDLLRQKPVVIPPEREEELAQVVEAHLELITQFVNGERRYRILTQRYGINDGIGKKNQGIDENISHQRISAIAKQSLRNLRAGHLIQMTGIRNYRILPENSLGRTLLGAVFLKDLPEGLDKVYLFDVPVFKEYNGELSTYGTVRDLLLSAELTDTEIDQTILAGLQDFLNNYSPPKAQTSLPTEGEIYPGVQIAAQEQRSQPIRERLITGPNRIYSFLKSRILAGDSLEETIQFLKKNKIKILGQTEGWVIEALYNTVLKDLNSE